MRASNTAAIALYERFGFRAAGTRPRYYADTGEDALIMWRTAETARDRSLPVILALETQLRRHVRGGDQPAAGRSAPT